MSIGNGKIRVLSGSNFPESMQSSKADRTGVLVVIAVVLALFVIAGVFAGCSYFGKSDYDKGTGFLKEKKFTEALYEFQKVDPDNKNFGNAQSKINYINGLLAFNDSKKPEAIIFLSKVKTDDEYYHDAQLMLGKLNEASIGNDLQSQIDDLKNAKDTVYVKKDGDKSPGRNKDPKDPKEPPITADLEASRKYVSDAGISISRFESIYQSARTAPLSTKGDFAKNMESVDKEFSFLKYTAQNKDAGILELKRMTSEWMSKRIAFIHQLVSEKSVSETNLSRPMREEGDRLYAVMMSQMKKVKKSV
jgi:hypothetical protein